VHVAFDIKEGVSKALPGKFTPIPIAIGIPGLSPPKRLREGEGGLIEIQ